MTEPGNETHTVVTLTTGARVGAVLAVLMLIVAGYLLWSPIQLHPSDGFPVTCGTAAAPPSDDLGRAACGEANVIRQWQAGAFATAAVVTALGAVYAFGVRRREESLFGSAREAEESGELTVNS